MNYLYIILIGVVVFVIIRRVMEKVQEDSQKNLGEISAQTIKDFGLVNPEAIKKYKQNLGEIVAYMGLHNNRTSAEEIAKVLGVTNDMAEKYLLALSKHEVFPQKDIQTQKTTYKIK